MKSLTLEAYKLFFYVTGSPKLSYYGSLVILAVLHVIFLMGMTLLLDGVIKTKQLFWVFAFPVNIVVWAVVLGINMAIVPPKIIDVAHNIHVRYTRVIVFSLLAAFILVYKFFIMH